jgi:2-polyprenyl-6-methoxyphenol hydroxylase-like FAD-dependent oxidoreductase
MMLGFLLARAGVDVIVLEKHADFLHDFRGDTIHPSTLEVMHELGLLDEFLRRPHHQMQFLRGQYGKASLVVDFSELPTVCKYIAMMPQWDFLDFLVASGRRYGGFHVMMKTAATDLIRSGERVVGVRATTESGPVEICADLVVGADGRRSTVRELAGLQVKDKGSPIDVLWMHLPRKPTDPTEGFGLIDGGRLLAMVNRGDYWQAAYVIPKGTAAELMKNSIGDFGRVLQTLLPWLGDGANALKSWDDVKLLTAKVDRLKRWHRPGLLCIGDAAHAMSPIGGVGVNVAVQDAVAAANILAEPLRTGTLTPRHLARVQARREWPTRVTQHFQLMMQKHVINPGLAGTTQLKPPLGMKLFQWIPLLRRLLGRFTGIGVRPEHVRTPELGVRSP